MKIIRYRVVMKNRYVIGILACALWLPGQALASRQITTTVESIQDYPAAPNLHIALADTSNDEGCPGGGAFRSFVEPAANRAVIISLLMSALLSGKQVTVELDGCAGDWAKVNMVRILK